MCVAQQWALLLHGSALVLVCAVHALFGCTPDACQPACRTHMVLTTTEELCVCACPPHQVILPAKCCLVPCHCCLDGCCALLQLQDGDQATTTGHNSNSRAGSAVRCPQGPSTAPQLATGQAGMQGATLAETTHSLQQGRSGTAGCLHNFHVPHVDLLLCPSPVPPCQTGPTHTVLRLNFSPGVTVSAPAPQLQTACDTHTHTWSMYAAGTYVLSVMVRPECVVWLSCLSARSPATTLNR